MRKISEVELPSSQIKSIVTTSMTALSHASVSNLVFGHHTRGKFVSTSSKLFLFLPVCQWSFMHSFRRSVVDQGAEKCAKIHMDMPSK